MTARITALVALGALLGTSAWAQDHRFEVSGSGGYTLSDGVTTDVAVRGGDGNLYNGIEPKDSAAWGLSFGYFVTENWEIEALYDVQRVHIEATLRQCGWKIAGKGNAAERLGLKRGTLQFRMKKLGIQRPGDGV